MLSRTATEDDVRKLFEQFGTIEEVTVLREQSTGKSRGRLKVLFFYMARIFPFTFLFIPVLFSLFCKKNDVFCAASDCTRKIFYGFYTVQSFSKKSNAYF